MSAIDEKAELRDFDDYDMISYVSWIQPSFMCLRANGIAETKN